MFAVLLFFILGLLGASKLSASEVMSHLWSSPRMCSPRSVAIALQLSQGFAVLLTFLISQRNDNQISFLRFMWSVGCLNCCLLPRGCRSLTVFLSNPYYLFTLSHFGASLSRQRHLLSVLQRVTTLAAIFISDRGIIEFSSENGSCLFSDHPQAGGGGGVETNKSVKKDFLLLLIFSLVQHSFDH